MKFITFFADKYTKMPRRRSNKNTKNDNKINANKLNGIIIDDTPSDNETLIYDDTLGKLNYNQQTSQGYVTSSSIPSTTNRLAIFSDTSGTNIGQATQSVNGDTFTSPIISCNTISTGQGNNELYPMDQAVRTTDNVIFANLTSTKHTGGLAQSYSCVMYGNGFQTLSANTPTKMILNDFGGTSSKNNISISGNNTSMGDNATNYRITIARSGNYLLMGHIGFAGVAGGHRGVWLYVNGEGGYGFRNEVVGTSAHYQNIHLSGFLYLAQDDYIELWGYQESTGTVLTGSNSNLRDRNKLSVIYISE